jgi:hypothetical protein
MANNIHGYVWNRALKDPIPYSKTWTYIILLTEPFIYQALMIIQFFTTLAMQLQFIIPEFLGTMLGETPLMIMRLNTLKFKYP